MLNPSDLIEMRKIAAMAAVFSSEDFRKATEVHAEKYAKLEEAHKEKLRSWTEQQKTEIYNLRQGVLEEENKLRAIEQANKEATRKLEQEKLAFETKYKDREAKLSKQEVTLHDAIAVQTLQDTRTAERLAKVVQREKRAAEIEQQCLADNRALQTRLDKLRALTA